MEFLRRLHMNIEEVVHLLLFNLRVQFGKRYYSLTNVINPYARDNWHALQLPPKVSSMKKPITSICGKLNSPPPIDTVEKYAAE